MGLPIVLAHGIARFDVWSGALQGLVGEDDSVHYFRRIKTALEREGHVVHHATVPWAAAIDQRAHELRRECARILARSGAPALNLICHSMGGLDARRMLWHSHLARDGFHRRIAGVATIGTPHLGTPFADAGLADLPGAIGFARALGLDLRGFADLTTRACAAFNREAREFEKGSGVRFLTWAGSQAEARTFAPLRGPWRLIAEHHGKNDGLVPVNSQLWRREYAQEHVEADHLQQVGWWHLDGVFHERPAALEARIQGMYRRIAARLPAAPCS